MANDSGAILWAVSFAVNVLATAVNVLAGNTLWSVVTSLLCVFTAVCLWRALRRGRR